MKRVYDKGDNYIKACFYGRPGVGKTWLVTSAANNSRTIYLDFEKGGKTATKNKTTFPLEIFIIESFEDLNTILTKLSDHLDLCSKVKNDLEWNKLIQLEAWFKDVQIDSIKKEDIIPFKHIVVDSLSETQVSSMEFFVPTTGLLAPAQPLIKNWGQNMNSLRFLLRALRDMPIHVWYTALEKIEEELQTDKTVVYKYGLKFTASLAEDVAALIDVIGHMTSRPQGVETMRVVSFHFNVNKLAKDRLNCFGKELVNTDISKMVAMYEKK